ncbi:hypothetical protein MMAG44476_34736 [Mycolicibacterium mageritense DSM 44476 = CIP 104973]|uniref:Zf-HC2 domain-containing protein n=2 Tax=Mycolicibacterium mageritense TaxID=53462 RepID=A0ABM7HW62_MYCME|nr:hypothetical protein MMAGJ_41270 [Mycolicibacterium mageritense]CDO20636.1 hypothetical protein BN978_01093 [Mycolicibacterium mageritense DSM 44476 = CIP 104973]
MVRAHIWAIRERGARLVLAAIDPDSDREEFLDAHVPECSACYRDLILELVDQASAWYQVEFGGRESAIEALHDELATIVKLSRDD